jgi:hypothetical protein
VRSFYIAPLSFILAACSGTAVNTNTPANANVANSASAANSNTSGAYPQSAKDAFLNSCEEAGSDQAFCNCVFEKVQAKYTFEEFSVIESKIVAGTPPEDFVEFTGKARAECTK